MRPGLEGRAGSAEPNAGSLRRGPERGKRIAGPCFGPCGAPTPAGDATGPAGRRARATIEETEEES